MTETSSHPNEGNGDLAARCQIPEKAFPTTVRATLPDLHALWAEAKGNPDLELIAARVEQIELLLEGIAELYAAQGDTDKAEAQAKVGEMGWRLKRSL